MSRQCQLPGVAAAVLLIIGLMAPALAAEEVHLRLTAPGALAPDKAQAIYHRIKKDLAQSYAPAHDPHARNYPRWQRFNKAPYLSATHGNRYVNNYANDKAAKAGYGTLKPGQRMPPGAVVVKDSVTVTKAGEIFPGALVYMEKLTPGRNPKTADWRFVQILPDGSYFGDTIGDNGDDVAFCFTCHKAMAEVDYLFFLPEEYRQ